ncbi:MAG: sterol desaturase family protein [Capsulimonas sp.]|uniref:sterol desaturase family protein n=1 Tax=Capsulimonas sp. TaxID=2494211 RepID=UPI003264F849
MAQLLVILLSLLRLSLWLAILVVIFAPLEYFFAVHSHKALRKGIGADLGYYFLNSLLPAAILSVPAAILGWSTHKILPGSLLEWTASLPFWTRALLGFVAGEVGYYWGHRWSHQIPFLWRFHSVHHSAEELDFLVNTRAHPLDMVFSRTCALVPMYVLGLGGPTSAAGGSTLPVLVTLVGTVWGFFIHANLKWSFGPLEWLVSTPKFHHWHHTKTGLIDHNYSSTLPWLDRIFGTHNLPKEWPESYGIDAVMPPAMIDQLLYPLGPPEAPALEKPAHSLGEGE